MTYLTSSAITIKADSILIQINKALTTETITLSAANGGTFAIITGAVAAGAQFRYGGLRSGGVITITPNAAIDATVTALNRNI